ncbi:HAD-IIIC family phosphatase [Puniceicoccaceae bacterium]|nr:HAD-IIIC family phosphatase [Puniceicoccaceae bacterium]
MKRDFHKKIESIWSRERHQLAVSLHEVVDEARSYAGEGRRAYEQLDEFSKKYLDTAVDIAVRWIASGRDELYYEYFVGWLKFCSNERLLADRSSRFSLSSVLSLFESWLEPIQNVCKASELDKLRKDLESLGRDICAESEKDIRVLFIGDCLKDEIIANLYGACAVEGVSLKATTLSQRVPVALRKELKEMADQSFDLIFYSPFSHAYSETFAEAVHPRNVSKNEDFLRKMLSSALDQAYTTLDLLGELFGAIVNVHNTAAVPQLNAGINGILKLALSSRNRKYVIENVGNAISTYIDLRNRDGKSQYRLVDEKKYLGQYSAYDLGKAIFDSGDLHPTLLGRVLAEREYLPVMVAKASLWSSKMVVCDLDNTLWQGVIGEGSVEHFHDRQQILKKLKSKGVVLSINSKNDEKNVHWTGGTLNQDDFVTSRINWGSKVANVKSIESELNLKAKDFIFVDDRPDEREMVKQGCEGITVLDACDDATWERMALWSEILPTQSDTDRTQLYKERAARGKFIAIQGKDHEEDEAQAYKDLGLVVKIREVSKGELKRVAELINRTNQFNMCGTRTSAQELADGLGKEQFVLQVEAADKFGSMGKVGAMVVTQGEEGLNIPVFVLSCRVFGFSIEHALLVFLKKSVGRGGKITGQFCETAHNAPCREVYQESGFTYDESQWVWNGGESGAYAEWLEVTEVVNQNLLR